MRDVLLRIRPVGLVAVVIVVALALLLIVVGLYPQAHLFPEGGLVLYYGQVMTRRQLAAEVATPMCTPLTPSSLERFVRSLADQPVFICFDSASELNDWLAAQGIAY